MRPHHFEKVVGEIFSSKFILNTIPLAIFLLSGCSNHPSAGKPNFLFIAIDDLRPELGCYGKDYVISPAIDSIASNGIVFTNAFCQSAVCNPSRASLMTGLRPDETRVWDLYTHFRNTIPDVVTLPQYLGKFGYHTVAIGKIYHNIFPDTLSWSEPKIYVKGFPFDPDAVYRSQKAIGILEKKKREILREGNQDKYMDVFGKWYLKATATESPDVPDSAYYDGAQTEVALRKLEELSKGKKPFFFGIGYYRPHLPFNVPERYWKMYNRDSIPLAGNDYVPEDAPVMAINNLRELRGYTDFSSVKHPFSGSISRDSAKLLKHGYLASVTYTDTQIAKLMKKLKQLNILDNTIIVIWGDNGWKLGEHNSWCKMTNYSIDTRVPLIISTPETRKKGIKCDALVEFVDIYPTICELAGLPVPSNLEGISMLPLFKNPDRPWKKATFSQFLREGIWSAPDGKEYMGRSIRTRKYLYVEWSEWKTGKKAAVELYDLVNDPGENRNIAHEPSSRRVVQKLSGDLKTGWKGALPESTGK